jgi:hypothetical protein
MLISSVAKSNMTDSINLTDYTEDAKPIPVKVYFNFNDEDGDCEIISIKYGHEVISPRQMDAKLHPDLISDIESEIERYSEQNRIKGEITHRFP